MSNLCEGSHNEEVLHLNNDHVVPKHFNLMTYTWKQCTVCLILQATYFCPNDIKFES